MRLLRIIFAGLFGTALILSVGCSFGNSLTSGNQDTTKIILNEAPTVDSFLTSSYGGGWQSVEEIGDIAQRQLFYITCAATDLDGDELSYKWTATHGSTISVNRHRPSEIRWTAPSEAAFVTIMVEVSDSIDTVRDSLILEVKKVGARLSLRDTTVFDFGYVPVSSDMLHRFRFLSSGDDSLHIAGQSCDCSVGVLPGVWIRPWSQGQFDIRLNSNPAIGKTTEQVSIFTNETDSQHVYELSYDAVPVDSNTLPVIIRPWVLDISQLQYGADSTNHLLFTIENLSNESVSLRLIDNPTRFRTMFEYPIIPARDTVEAVIQLNGSNQFFSFTGSITLEVIGTTTTRFTIPVIRNLGF